MGKTCCVEEQAEGQIEGTDAVKNNSQQADLVSYYRDEFSSHLQAIVEFMDPTPSPWAEIEHTVQVHDHFSSHHETKFVLQDQEWMCAKIFDVSATVDPMKSLRMAQKQLEDIKNFSSLLWSCLVKISSPMETTTELVNDINCLKPGDHIAFSRDYAFVKLNHHAIVESVDRAARKYTVIEYTGGADSVLFCSVGRKTSVRRNTHKFKDDRCMYKVVYKSGALDPIQTLTKAVKRLGEEKYNPLSNNCEHFATYCKTGEAHCFQKKTDVFGPTITAAQRAALYGPAITAAQRAVIKGEELSVAALLHLIKTVPPWYNLHLASFSDQAIKMAGTAIAAAEKSALATACGKPFAAISATAQKFGGAYVGAAAQKISGAQIGAATRNIVGAYVGAAANVAVDACLFYRHCKKLKDQLESGNITSEVYREQLAESSCESAIGCLSSIGGMVAGQILCPIPIVGGVVGSVLGNIAGRYIGRRNPRMLDDC